ncbi:MAG: hypothetical protein ABIP41_07695 [Croceibacterium sp.]
MVLLVGLASIIMTNARRNQDPAVAQAQTAAASDAAAGPASDPLADAGVVPDMPASSKTPAPDAQTAGKR